jgi:hypothetical protein
VFVGRADARRAVTGFLGSKDWPAPDNTTLLASGNVENFINGPVNDNTFYNGFHLVLSCELISYKDRKNCGAKHAIDEMFYFMVL